MRRCLCPSLPTEKVQAGSIQSAAAKEKVNLKQFLKYFGGGREL
jgi:hypothetical protein